jgi:hypothetical protein
MKEKKNVKSCYQKDSSPQTGTGTEEQHLFCNVQPKLTTTSGPTTRPHVPQDRRPQMHHCGSQKKSPSRPRLLVGISRNLVPSKVEIGGSCSWGGTHWQRESGKARNRVRETDRERATRQNQIIAEASGFVCHNRNRTHELLSHVTWLVLLLNGLYSTAGKTRYLKPLQFTLISRRACVSPFLPFLPHLLPSHNKKPIVTVHIQSLMR